MDTLTLAVAVAGAIITSQGAVWRPVTVQTINTPDPVIYTTTAGSVTSDYKKKKPALDCIPGNPKDSAFSLSCAAKRAIDL